MGTNTGTIMTLANSIIGVSVLAMPFCFKQCGIALSILMLIASSLLSRLACHFLLKSAVMARRRTFEFLAFHTFGPTGKLAVELFIIGFLMGTCIAFFVVMGDLGPAIMAKILGLSNTVSLRPSVLIGLALFVVLPLGMLRNVDSLSSVSMATIGFYICLVLKVVGESLPHLLAGDWYEHVNFWRPAGILQCIPIFSMALFCQTQLFEIYESMHNASLDRMNFVIRAACNICTGVYICVGFFGYIAFCTQPFTGNVLMSFTPSIVSEMIKLGFVLSVAVSFPLVIFPCRASLYSLLFRRITMPHHEGVGSHIPEARFKCLTIFIISVTLVIGLLIPNIELVLGLVGSTIGVLICVMFPAAAFICMSTKSSNDRLMAQVLLFVGALILVLGTYATLNSANVTKPSEIINKPAAGTVEKSPHFHDKIDNSLADIPPKLEQRPQSDVKKFGEESKKVPELVVEMKIPKVEQPEDPRADVSQGGKRQEPPVPVEPAGIMKDPTVVSLIKDEKTAVRGVEKEQGKEKIQKVDPEKKVANAEIEKKEIKSVGEQVDQDAIKKEEDELAEAEKRDDNAGNSKNEEILRKLEKHEAQQMKILEEQKQILQALQEHQERELFKEHQEHSAKNLNQTKIVERHEVKIDDLRNQKNEENKEVKDPVKNSYEKAAPTAKKQDLLKKIANGELNKPIGPVPPETVASVKTYQPPERHNKTIPSEKKPFVAEGPVMKIQESLHVAAPDLAVKPEGSVAPVQPLLLERLKGQPLPLTLHHNETKPFISPDSDKKPLLSESGVNAMRREILQESVVGTQTSVIQADVKNASVVLRDILSPQIRGELHDREKRDIEKTEPTNIINTVVALNNAGQLNISNEGTQPPQQENCHITEKSVSSELKHMEMYKKPKKDDDGSAPAVELVTDVLSPSLLPEVAKAASSVNVPQVAINSSQVEETVLVSESPAVANSNYSVSLKSASVSNIENAVIKSVTHLSNPKVKSNENNDVTILRQGVSPDAKPMKRDLKSISLVEDKDTTQKKNI
ncbi:hypothetical protein R5R35_009263 [Gryllus longicercus]|uniref:Amino acid transporter transmembrane domain-containing protein n=1 Tax=Gryllus longicercus TaxID=2509291 RepID=A0AAN9VAB7_9ORTH